MNEVSEILKDIHVELSRANKIHKPKFASLHEGYGIINEEFDELWDEIKRKEPVDMLIVEEATQLAAMCVKLIMFVKEESR